MVVEIKTDVFKSAPQGLSLLIQLCLYKQRYDAFVDIGKVLNEQSFSSLADSDREALIAQFNASLQGVQKKPDIVVSEKDPKAFGTDEAIRYLGQPVSILLENSLNDSYFIKAVLTHFRRGNVVKKHLENGWIVFENGGGCPNIRNFLNGKLISYDDLPKENFNYLRCLVILDSDKRYPMQQQKKAYNDLIDEFEVQNVHFHILQKRNMENYLPLEVYANLMNRMERRFIDAFLSMSAAQIDHYNIQAGFEGKQRNLLDQPVAAHYNSISDVTYELLKNGCGLKDFKTEFPVFMKSHAVHKQTLLNRTSHQDDPNELQRISDMVEQMI